MDWLVGGASNMMLGLGLVADVSRYLFIIAEPAQWMENVEIQMFPTQWLTIFLHKVLKNKDREMC